MRGSDDLAGQHVHELQAAGGQHVRLAIVARRDHAVDGVLDAALKELECLGWSDCSGRITPHTTNRPNGVLRRDRMQKRAHSLKTWNHERLCDAATSAGVWHVKK